MRTIFVPLCLVTCLLAGCGSEAPVRGGGIVSTNPCADQLLLALAPDRVAAISHYSLDPTESSISPRVAAGYRATAGTAEEVIALNPALVVASSFTPPATRDAYTRARLETLYLDSPTTIAASEEQVLAIATAVGALPRGRALVRAIDDAVAASRSKGYPVDALLFLGGDLVSGEGTLLDEMMRHTGFRNAAADYGLRRTGRIGVEAIAAKPPTMLLVPDPEGRAASARRRVLVATGASTTQAGFSRRLVNCGGPTIATALIRLAAIRRSLRL